MTKLMNHPIVRKSTGGKGFQINNRKRWPRRQIDPRGILSTPSDGLSDESKDTMLKYKQLVKTGLLKINYP